MLLLSEKKLTYLALGSEPYGNKGIWNMT